MLAQRKNNLQMQLKLAADFSIPNPTELQQSILDDMTDIQKKVEQELQVVVDEVEFQINTLRATMAHVMDLLPEDLD